MTDSSTDRPDLPVAGEPAPPGSEPESEAPQANTQAPQVGTQAPQAGTASEREELADDEPTIVVEPSEPVEVPTEDPVEAETPTTDEASADGLVEAETPTTDEASADGLVEAETPTTDEASAEIEAEDDETLVLSSQEAELAAAAADGAASEATPTTAVDSDQPGDVEAAPAEAADHAAPVEDDPTLVVAAPVPPTPPGPVASEPESAPPAQASSEPLTRTSILRAPAPAEPGPSADMTPTEITPGAAVAVASPPTPPPTTPPAPPKGADQRKPRRRGRAVLIALAAVLLVLGGAYVGAVFYTAERTPAQASIAQVEVGGMTRDEAQTTFAEGIAPRAAEPVAVTVGDLAADLDPAQSGLAVDVEASVDQITGRSWDPRVVLNRLFGSDDVNAVTTVDTGALTAALSGAQDAVDVPPVDATIALAGTEAVVTDPVEGAGLDVAAAVEQIPQEWLTTTEPLALPLTTLTPALDQADVDEAMSTIVEPLLSAPVTVAVAPADAAGGEPITTSLDPATMAAASSVVGLDGRFVLEMHGDQLVEAISTQLPDIGSASKDATFEFVDGAPSIVPSESGTGLDEEQVADVVEVAAVETAGRVANAELVSAEAEFTTEDAEALGVTEIIAEFSTPLPGGNDVPRTNNLRNGAAMVTGVLLKPGETFSLLESLGPIDGAHGYYQSGVVVNGNASKAWGGGLSQLSTTLFNAAFEAGMEDVTHQPHSRWFTRYPAGREATVFEGQIDMQFLNRSDHGVLVQAWVADGRTWARLWGTKTFNTEIVSSGKYNYVAPRTIYNTSDECTPESGGSSGFSIDVTRTVTRLDGSPVESTGYSWSYSAWNTIVCGPDPATLPEPEGDAPPEGEG